MSDLLPINATSGERAQSIAVQRIGNVPTIVRELWDPDTCPPNLLAWLAWAFSVDQWNQNWEDSQKRETIKRSIAVHKYKGTIGAVRDALGALGVSAQVQEWFNQAPAGDPYTFAIILEASQVGISQASVQSLLTVVERTKNLRSHLSLIETRVKTQAGPTVAAVAVVGSEVCLTGYTRPSLVFNETAICF